MLDRASVEKDINDTRRVLGQIEKDVKQLRDWIATNERNLSGMQESLRRITEEGIAKARADLASHENELQRLRSSLAHNETLLKKIQEIERKTQDISTLEQEQEKIVVLLERHRTELRQLQQEYEELTRPAVVMPCELVLPNNQRIPLDPARMEYTIGWHDGGSAAPPEIDLHPLGGSGLGVSRRHATLRWDGTQWSIIDLASTNGTYLNDAPIAPNRPTPLHDRTKVRLGNMMLFFRYITQTTRL